MPARVRRQTAVEILRRVRRRVIADVLRRVALWHQRLVAAAAVVVRLGGDLLLGAGAIAATGATPEVLFYDEKTKIFNEFF